MGDYMSCGGMTRRIDELGRLVIPKEIRRNLKIKDNDQIEISISNDHIILSKYDFLQKDAIIHQFLLCIKKSLNKNILYTSREKIVDYAILNKEKLDDINLSNELMHIIENRKEIISNNNNINVFNDVYSSYYIVSPIIVNGDLYGSLILFGDAEIGDVDINIMRFSCLFLENYLE